jgi:hypothetical protein
MASQYGKPIEGERHTPKYPRDYPALPSGLQPLPFYPNLKRELRSVTGALVLTYLEIYYPPPQDASGALLSAPVTLHLDQISEDLQISRRTLFTQPGGEAKRLVRAQPAPAASSSILHTPSMGRQSFTRSPAQSAISLTQSSSFVGTFRSSQPRSKMPESLRSRNKSLWALTVSRLWTPPPFQRQLRTVWGKKNHFRKSCRGHL